MEESFLFRFEKLQVYQKTMDHLENVYEVIEKFPVKERFNLKDQYLRAATSVCLNLGEGSGGTDNEFRHFIRISFRSLCECIVCCTIARRRNYIDSVAEKKLRLQALEIQKMLSRLSTSLA
jgi:four helix bundle protein